jgi:hypothetical protein
MGDTLSHDAAWRLAQRLAAQRRELADADFREAFAALYRAALEEMEKVEAASALRARRLDPTGQSHP